MAKQTFTAGQTLTAQQMNDLQTNDFNMSVTTQTANYTLVAADKGTREVANAGSAITFTVPNNVFAAGDIVDIHNINTGLLTLAAGTGMTLSSADVLTVNQWQGGTLYFTSTSASIWFPRAKTVSAGGLVLVQAQTSFSNAASVTADSVFTSTYETYLVRVRITTNAGNLLYRLRASGTSSSADYGHIRARNVSGTGLSATAQSAQTSGFIDGTLAGASVRAVDLILNGPQLALETPWLAHGYGVNTDDVTFDAYWTGGLHNVATTYDGIELLSSSGNITGNYTIYGYAKS